MHTCVINGIESGILLATAITAIDVCIGKVCVAEACHIELENKYSESD